MTLQERQGRLQVLWEEIADLLARKGKTYGSPQDAHINYRLAAATIDVPIEAYMLARVQEKLIRISGNISDTALLERELRDVLGITALILVELHDAPHLPAVR